MRSLGGRKGEVISFVKSYGKWMVHNFGKILVFLNIVVVITISNFQVRRPRLRGGQILSLIPQLLGVKAEILNQAFPIPSLRSFASQCRKGTEIMKAATCDFNRRERPLPPQIPLHISHQPYTETSRLEPCILKWARRSLGLQTRGKGNMKPRGDLIFTLSVHGLTSDSCEEDDSGGQPESYGEMSTPRRKQRRLRYTSSITSLWPVSRRDTEGGKATFLPFREPLVRPLRACPRRVTQWQGPTLGRPPPAWFSARRGKGCVLGEPDQAAEHGPRTHSGPGPGRNTSHSTVKERRDERTGFVHFRWHHKCRMLSYLTRHTLSTRLLTTTPLPSLSSHLSSSCTPGYSSICSRTGLCPLAPSLPSTALSTRSGTNPETDSCRWLRSQRG